MRKYSQKASDKQVSEAWRRKADIRSFWNALLKVPEFQKILIKKGITGADKSISKGLKLSKTHKIGVNTDSVSNARAGIMSHNTRVFPRMNIDNKKRKQIMQDYFTKEYLKLKKKNKGISKQEASTIIGEKFDFGWEYVSKLIKVKEESKGFPPEARMKVTDEKSWNAVNKSEEIRGLVSAFQKVPEMQKLKKRKGVTGVDKSVSFITSRSAKKIGDMRQGKLGRNRRVIMEPVEKGYDYAGKKALRDISKALNKKELSEMDKERIFSIMREKQDNHSRMFALSQEFRIKLTDANLIIQQAKKLMESKN